MKEFTFAVSHPTPFLVPVTLLQIRSWQSRGLDGWVWDDELGWLRASILPHARSIKFDLAGWCE